MVLTGPSGRDRQAIISKQQMAVCGEKRLREPLRRV
jgi:hypothetical protein